MPPFAAVSVSLWPSPQFTVALRLLMFGFELLSVNFATVKLPVPAPSVAVGGVNWVKTSGEEFDPWMVKLTTLVPQSATKLGKLATGLSGVVGNASSSANSLIAQKLPDE